MKDMALSKLWTAEGSEPLLSSAIDHHLCAFGHERLKTVQYEVVHALLRGQDVLRNGSHRLQKVTDLPGATQVCSVYPGEAGESGYSCSARTGPKPIAGTGMRVECT